MILTWTLLATVWVLFYVAAGDLRYVRHWLNAIFPLAILLVVLTILAATGGTDVADKALYTTELEALSFAPFREVFDAFTTDGREPAFLLFVWIVGLFTHDAFVFFVCTAAFSSVMLALSYQLILRSAWQTVIVVFLTFAFGFFVNYAGLVLRQGLSITFMLLAVALVIRQAKIHWILAALVIAVLFHWSAVTAAVLILTARLISFRSNVLIAVWAVASVLYLTGLNGVLLSPLDTLLPDVATYTDRSLATSYSGGTNRVDFWLLSLAFVGYGSAAGRLSSTPAWYSKLFHMYVLLNTYYLIMGFIYFSDRLAAYSWSLVPLLAAVPALNYSGRGQRLVLGGVIAAFVLWGVYFGSFDRILWPES
jgi:hypothetical protein